MFGAGVGSMVCRRRVGKRDYIDYLFPGRDTIIILSL